jgi:hypothetical protein
MRQLAACRAKRRGDELSLLGGRSLEHAGALARRQRRAPGGDLNGLVEEALNLAYHAARAQDENFNITLERELGSGVGPIGLVPQDMTRVLLNLICNGFYTPTKRGGNVAEARIIFARVQNTHSSGGESLLRQPRNMLPPAADLRKLVEN